MHAECMAKQFAEVPMRKQSLAAMQVELEVPKFINLGRMEPLRGTPRLKDEDCSDEAFLKRHEKREKQEKLMERRDISRQREKLYRMRLLKISGPKEPEAPNVEIIKLVYRLPKGIKANK